MLIKEIYIYSEGDPSVGIGPNSCTIQADGSYILDTGGVSNEREYLEGIRTALKEQWGDFFDDRFVRVTFDFETRGEPISWPPDEPLYNDGIKLR